MFKKTHMYIYIYVNTCMYMHIHKHPRPYIYTFAQIDTFVCTCVQLCDFSNENPHTEPIVAVEHERQFMIRFANSEKVNIIQFRAHGYLHHLV